MNRDECEDDFRLEGGHQPLARNKESRRVRRFSRHRTASGEAAADELETPRIQSPATGRRTRIRPLSGGTAASGGSSTADTELAALQPHLAGGGERRLASRDLSPCSPASAYRRTSSRSASRHRQRQLSDRLLSPVRGETAAVDTVEQLLVRQRIAGIQRSFTQVLKESSIKRAEVC